MKWTLDAPWALLGLIPVAFLAGYLVWRRLSHKEPTFRFPSTELVDTLPTTLFVRLRWLPDALRILALAAVVVALARPQLRGPPQSDDAEGIDIVLALDTSCSMRAADFQPKDRMSVAKKSVGELILSRKNDRVGLVVFGGEAATWVPLTLDYSLVVKMMDELEVGMIGDGTAIGNALGTALNRLRESEAESRVVVLLTDGDNNAGSISPTKAAQFAKELGVRIYTILIGRGGPVPFPAGEDLFGRVVYRERVIPTNPELLESLAQRTGGTAYTASDKDELDQRLGEVLDNLERTRLEATSQLETYLELFPHLVGLALLLLALELALANTRFRRFP